MFSEVVSGMTTNNIPIFKNTEIRTVEYAKDESGKIIGAILIYKKNFYRVICDDITLVNPKLVMVEKYDYDKLYFVSNVPYYITSPIILKLVDSGVSFNKIIMMVQKEVGDRFSTQCGNKEYGSITVLLNYFYNVNESDQESTFD